MENIKTDDFRHFIKEGGRAPLPSPEEMDALVAAYPWFVTARVVRGLAGKEYTTGRGYDPQLAMHLNVFPLPFQGLYHVDAEDFNRAPEENNMENFPEDGEHSIAPSEEKIIENFLAGGEHRITPPEENETDEEVPDMAAAAATPEIVTEELAEIYLSQQLWRQAREVYEKLSLLYPKKSVYFADIIERINSKM